MLSDCGMCFAGKRVAIYGSFAYWPTYHGATPEEVIERCGGTLTRDVDSKLDILVLAEMRGTGRAEAKAKAARLVKRALKKEHESGEKQQILEILDEETLREMVRYDTAGRRFAFAGEFEHCPHGLQEGWLARMVESAGGVFQEGVDEALDFLVLGNRRARGKTAAVRRANELVEAGRPLRILDEEGFLELVRIESPGGESLDFATLLGGMYGVLDAKRIARALKMLKAESFQLYSDVGDERLVGVVRSQTRDDTVYAPWIDAKGRFGCCSQDLDDCMGLQGSLCKHLILLVLGLAAVGVAPLETMRQWINRAGGKRPKRDQDLCADTLIRYKGAEAGEIDWRPVETVPEDFYAF